MKETKQRLTRINLTKDKDYSFSFIKRKHRYAQKFNRIKYHFPTKLEAMVVWDRLRISHKVTNSVSPFPLNCVIPEGYHILHKQTPKAF